MSATSHNGKALPQDPLAKGLGVFSFALGLPQVLAPRRMTRLIGVRDDATSRAIMRLVGVRELAAGVGLFTARKPTEWVWARVAGDTMDLALLGSALRGRSTSPAKTLAATGAVAGAFAADVIDGVKLTRSDGSSSSSSNGSSEEEHTAPIQVRATVTVRRDPDDLFARWRDFERFPQFMAHLEEVKAIDGRRSHWKARAPLGISAEWDAEITEELPGERISWRSVEGSRIATTGTVSFTPAPGDRGTEIHVDLRYGALGGAVGAMFAKLFGEEPAIQLKDDLRRFKQIAETGEIVRSDGTPEGPRGMRMVKQRPAHPLPDDEVATLTGGAS